MRKLGGKIKKTLSYAFALNVLACVAVGVPLSGCSTGPKAATARFETQETARLELMDEVRPARKPLLAPEGNPHPFEGSLPLGLGARFDFFVSNTADQLSEVYDVVIKPVRHGKLFGESPYTMNYSILPDSGEAFHHDGGIDTEPLKSNYKIQAGMSRKFHDFKDFLSADFWLAKGRHNPAHVKPRIEPKPQIQPIKSESETLELDFIPRGESAGNRTLFPGAE